MMAATHVSIPKSFSSGDVREWFQKFEKLFNKSVEAVCSTLLTNY